MRKVFICANNKLAIALKPCTDGVFFHSNIFGFISSSMAQKQQNSEIICHIILCNQQ